MPNAWQDYTALIFVFYNRSGINIFTQMVGDKTGTGTELSD